jgi:GDP/UDP-N,N'-diacetylbacillosamine 2-epimerase (hydrolysing)
MKTIAIFTTTRAEFGILSAFINEIERNEDTRYLLFVGGSHLAIETGNTIKEIRKLNYNITDTFDYQLNLANDSTIAKSIGFCTIELTHIFQNHHFDFVCVLGDRLELLSIITNALVFGKPIIHIHGGERSEGAIDEQIRHMITKASHIHFAACKEYADNIIKMGEQAWRVHNVGALAVDNMVNLPKISKEELFNVLSLDGNQSTILMTYHPVTLEFDITPLTQIQNIFEALRLFDYQVVITAPNADKDRDVIFEYINEQVNLSSNIKFVDSLGVRNYLSLIPFCSFVIGNSSSAIIEVPFYKIPVINIGNRQKGRFMHDNIITCDYSTVSIVDSIKKAISFEFQNKFKGMDYEFGDGKVATRMLEVIRNTEINEQLLRKQLVFSD